MDTPTAPAAFLSTLEPTSERTVHLADFLRSRGFAVTLSATAGDPRHSHWFGTELPRAITEAQLFVAIESVGYDASTGMALEFDMAARRSHQDGEPLLVLWKQGEAPLAKGFAGYEKAAAKLPAETQAAMTALAKMLHKKGWLAATDDEETAGEADATGAPSAGGPGAADPAPVEHHTPEAEAKQPDVEAAAQPAAETEAAQPDAEPEAAQPAVEPEAAQPAAAQPEAAGPRPDDPGTAPASQPTAAEPSLPPGPPGATVPTTPASDPVDTGAPLVAEPPALEPAPAPAHPTAPPTNEPSLGGPAGEEVTTSSSNPQHSVENPEKPPSSEQ